MDDMSDYEKKLKELCTAIIDAFDCLKAKGEISEEEYQKHTTNKKAFLDDTMNISE